MGWSSNDSSDGGRRRQKKKKQKRTTAACTGVLMRLNSMQGRPIDRCAPHSLHRRQAHPLVGAVLGHQECHLLFCLPFAGCQTGNACGSRFLSAFSHMKNQFIDFFSAELIGQTTRTTASKPASQLNDMWHSCSGSLGFLYVSVKCTSILNSRIHGMHYVFGRLEPKKERRSVSPKSMWPKTTF